MRITIIAVVGILSYLLVLLPGYFLFFSEDDAKSEVTELLTKVFESGSGDKSAEKLPLTNPGDAPPPK
ncbi:MAG: hypothetical protein VYD14_09150 [SAR324 cluster bacterium]|jgi:hypothetical protein|nr:hypothetical protein [SAR324 cluster bacterium]MEC8980696.1 hypothetical protein [SAR324 cluster bacterium]MEC9010944.1 hypothetical protein [SAR324 cluster bacterium]MEC9461358.1 hypothetical protein [SAR324 cluster bacterium]MED5435396.1 hypothetical protein [SAR324 cluster bacterium]